MPAAERHLRPVDPIDEPILVTLPEGHLLIEPDNPAWPVAWAWREEKAARELVEADLRSKRGLIRKLQDDQDAKRKAYGKRDVIDRIFDRWRIRSGHLRAKLTPERFDATRARLEEKYSELDALMSIEGLIAKAVVKDGVRYDDFEVCMRNGKQLERYANLCPAEVRAELKAAEPGDQMAMPAPS